MPFLRTGCLVAAVVITCGCASTPTNPSFDLSISDAEAALVDMAEAPVPLRRPLVIVAGWGDPGFADAYIADIITPRLDDDRIIRVSFSDLKTFEACREHLVAAVDEAFPTQGGASTREVDVVANSMGGIIAHYAADPDGGGRHLRVVRLFAISSPFLGAKAAGNVPTTDPILLDMRRGSDFLKRLNAPSRNYRHELIPYVRLGDAWVGQANTAPPGMHPWWVPGRAFEPAHLIAFTDPRILADILRQLRGETPYISPPAAPLPGSN
ncbi:MAG: hypothetical protein AAFX05_04595 [Planctomycetota bacterium]